MSEPLRQPRSFWQWLTNQPGTLWVPPLPPIVRMNPPRTALDAIESAIERLHNEMDDLRDDEYVRDNQSYQLLVAELGRLHEELVRRSQAEYAGGTANGKDSSKDYQVQAAQA